MGPASTELETQLSSSREKFAPQLRIPGRKEQRKHTFRSAARVRPGDDPLSEEPEFDLKALLGLPDEEPAAPTAFEQSVGEALAAAVAAMRVAEIVEVEDANVDALVTELREAAVQSSSLKKLLRRVVGTLVHSTRVEEVYGTDAELTSFLRGFFERG